MLLNAVIVPVDACLEMDLGCFLRGGFRSALCNHVKQIKLPYTGEKGLFMAQMVIHSPLKVNVMSYRVLKQ